MYQNNLIMSCQNLVINNGKKPTMWRHGACCHCHHFLVSTGCCSFPVTTRTTRPEPDTPASISLTRDTLAFIIYPEMSTFDICHAELAFCH